MRSAQKRTFCLALVFMSVLFINLSANADEIRLTSCNWEPYTGEDLEDYGFTAEILSEAFKRTGHRVSFTFLPWERALLKSAQGTYDGLYSAYYTEERARTYLVSEPYCSSTVVLCARKGSPVTFSTLEDLSPYRIGTVRGYANSVEFDAADYLTKEEVPSDLINIRKLVNKRIDLMVVDTYVVLYLLDKEGIQEDVEFLSPPLDRKPLHVMFSRRVEGYEKKCADFNKGLTEIREDGTYNQILRRHGFGELIRDEQK